GYGDPRPWSLQDSTELTILSFLNCEKYPPSLLFVLMTLGPALLALAWCDQAPGLLGRLLVTFGRVPLFYYLLHVPLIRLVAAACAWARYGDIGFLRHHPMLIQITHPGELPQGYGYGLIVVYVVWLAVLAALYPACRWFAGVKARRREAWLSYL